MTGYGKSVLQLPNKNISIEIKSLNSKTLDSYVRTPSIYREKELDIRKLLGSKLERGKIDFSLFIENNGEEISTQLNKSVVKKYMKQLHEIVGGNEIELLKMAVRMPEALNTERDKIDENEWKAIENEIIATLEKIEQYRGDEGLALEKEFKTRIENIDALLTQVIEIDPERIIAVRERLLKGVSDLKEKVDENRFEQELVYYIEKFDITEEKVRLHNHLEYFTKSIDSQDSNGKKLGFIAQEIGREINTIGSKANYAPMQKLVVQMKDELEKVKEQLLNVL
jgi:uncharacterized protein (TIGR00255 family)